MNFVIERIKFRDTKREPALTDLIAPFMKEFYSEKLIGKILSFFWGIIIGSELTLGINIAITNSYGYELVFSQLTKLEQTTFPKSGTINV
jgi:hypothetical protein